MTNEVDRLVAKTELWYRITLVCAAVAVVSSIVAVVLAVVR